LSCACPPQLVLNTRGWFTHKEAVLHEGEGGIAAVALRGALVAWANGRGVKIYDIERVRHKQRYCTVCI
jgi:hypothetical protein